MINSGQADPTSIWSSGTSRGGFLALHYARHDPRVAGALAYCPITDLARTRWFAGLEDNALVQQLKLLTHHDELVGRPTFLIIGDRDDVVLSESTVTLAQHLASAAKAGSVPSLTDLHVLSEPGGHTMPKGGQLLAASWILKNADGVTDDVAFSRALGH